MVGHSAHRATAYKKDAIMKLFGNPISGNTHRAVVLLNLLSVPFDYHTVNLKAGEHKTPEFLALNPLGQVPVLVDGDLVLRDSSAIMTYLAEKYDTSGTWLPRDPQRRAQVQEWLSTAVNEIQNGPFVVRAIKLFGVPADPATAAKKASALYDALLEPHLTGRDWLVGDAPTLADLACYSYTARVTDGDFSLEPYPAMRAWLARCEAIEGFTPMMKVEDMATA